MRKLIMLGLLTLIATFLLAGCAKKETPTELPAEKPAKEEAKKEKTFQLTSPAFKDRKRIPVKYATEEVTGGKNLSIPLQWENVPEGTKSFAIAMVDKHPVANNWVHWLVINIPSDVDSLPEGASGKNMPPGSKELNNTYGYQGYGGPQPPPGTGDHDYVITVYALNVGKLDLDADTSLSELMQAISDKEVASAQLTGLFSQ